MKTTQLATSARNGKVNGARPQAGRRLPDAGYLDLPPRTDRSRIQWPSGQQIQEISKHLARISREGKRREIAGDYFKSGDLAFQLQDIIRATSELLKKSQRG